MSKIPAGATHTAPNGTYRMARGSLWHGYADGDWVYIEGASPNFYTKIQAEPEWDGEGLPPVGMVCEYNARGNGKGDPLFLSVEVKYVSDQSIVIMCIGVPEGENKENIGVELSLMVGVQLTGKFRPIKTPEQISAEKRDAAIKEMQRLVGSCNTFPFAELYDYGYRLQVEK